jgi:hypothetical protein
VLARLEEFLNENYDLIVSRKKTFVRAVTDKSQCLGHAIWRGPDGGSEIDPLPDRVDRLRERLTQISLLEVNDKQKNNMMTVTAAGWAGYYQPRHRAEQLAAAVLAEVKASAATRSPPRTVRPARPDREGNAYVGAALDCETGHEHGRDENTGDATARPLSTEGAATEGRSATDDESPPWAAPARKSESGSMHPHPRLARILAVMNHLGEATRADLVEAVGFAVIHLNEVKHEIAELQLKLGNLQDEKRRRIEREKHSAVAEVFDTGTTGRQRALADKELSRLIKAIRELESTRDHLETERQTCEAAIRVIGWAIEAPVKIAK